MEYHLEVKNHVDNVDLIIITERRSVVQKWQDATNARELDILHEFAEIKQSSQVYLNNGIKNV
jgi:hypothetical protein